MRQSFSEVVFFPPNLSAQQVTDAVLERTGAGIFIKVSEGQAHISGLLPEELVEKVRAVITDLGIPLDS